MTISSKEHEYMRRIVSNWDDLDVKEKDFLLEKEYKKKLVCSHTYHVKEEKL